MDVIGSPHEVFARLSHDRRNGKTVGFVPTMGALHAGHLSLVQQSKTQTDRTVVSIFVNPTQFGPHEDFQRYPRPIEDDLKLLRQAGVDYVFVPEPTVIYPKGFSTYVEPPAVSRRWEGECRPGHFRGVATVVLKLFQIVPADIAFFGRKDYQQVRVISQMVEDLAVPIRIETCETLREADGLAMSSRNRYLQSDQRNAALGLWNALEEAKKLYSLGERQVSELERVMQAALHRAGVDRVEYAVVVDSESLEPIAKIEQSAVALIAAFVGTTRLIDNRLLEGP